MRELLYLLDLKIKSIQWNSVSVIYTLHTDLIITLNSVSTLEQFRWWTFRWFPEIYFRADLATMLSQNCRTLRICPTFDGLCAIWASLALGMGNRRRNLVVANVLGNWCSAQLTMASGGRHGWNRWCIYNRKEWEKIKIFHLLRSKRSILQCKTAILF